jgi:hypothetical protein
MRFRLPSRNLALADRENLAGASEFEQRAITPPAKAG